MKIRELFSGKIARLGSAALLAATLFGGVSSVAQANPQYYRTRRVVVPQRRVIVSPGYYSNYPSYRSNGFVQRAQQFGYSDGVARGRYDRSIGARRGKPTGHGAYQFALNGWDRDWGSAGVYQQYYRQAFIQGYWAGFSGR